MDESALAARPPVLRTTAHSVRLLSENYSVMQEKRDLPPLEKPMKSSGMTRGSEHETMVMPAGLGGEAAMIAAKAGGAVYVC